MDLKSVVFELGQVRSIPRHSHNDPELFFLLKGMVYFELDGNDYIMHENDIIICNSMQIRAARSTEQNLMLRLTINREYLLREIEELDFSLSCNSCDKSRQQNYVAYEQAARFLRRMLILYYQDKQGYTLKSKSVLLQFLSFLQENFKSPCILSSKNNCDARIYSIIQQIGVRYHEDLSLQEFAQKEHFSLHYLSRLFKREVGKGFSQYLNEVRLASSVHDLLHSNESIVKIALRNGFSGSSRFNWLFLKTYGATPAQYRAKRRNSQQLPTQGVELVQVFENSSDIIKYLRQFDAKYCSSLAENISYNLDIQTPTTGLQMPQLVVRVGRACHLLKTDVQKQINELNKEVKIDFVHFRCLVDDGMYEYEPEAVYADFEYCQIFDFLLDLNLSAYIQLLISDKSDLEKLYIRLPKFLNALSGYYPREFLDKWKIEIFFDNYNQGYNYQEEYQRIVNIVKDFLPMALISLGITDRSLENAQEKNAIRELLAQLDIYPDSLSMYLKYMEHQHFMEDVDYKSLQHIAAKQVQAIYHLLQIDNKILPPIDLQQWSTLSGFVTAESNSFYRCALFLDEIINLPKTVTHIACWLNTYLYESHTGTNRFDVVSLYLFDTLKRPLYFALRMLNLLNTDLFCHQEHLLSTIDAKGNIGILIINPCYFDPQKASDLAFVETQRRTFKLHLSSLNGYKIVERYNINNRTSALYDHWANMGFPVLFNRKVVNQLRQLVHMDYSIYNEFINDSYELSLTLNFNEVALIIIRSKD